MKRKPDAARLPPAPKPRKPPVAPANPPAARWPFPLGNALYF